MFSEVTSKSNLITTIKNLFDEQKDCDVTFNVLGEEIKAHKLILSNRSSVLKVMIDHPMSYVDGKILISDPNVSVSDFRKLLKFFYTDECEITKENVKTMLHLRHMYDVPLLFEKCAEFVRNNLKSSNILEYAELGLLYENQCTILSKCLKRIPKHFTLWAELNENISKFSFIGASPELVLKIFKKCKENVDVNEEKLFNAIMEWTHHECLSNNIEPTPSNVNEILKDIIPFINFEELKPITLATIVYEYNFLSTENLLDCIRKSVIYYENLK